MANMRDVMRFIAHENMKRLGYVHVNKKKFKERSFFSLNWRKYTQYIPEKSKQDA